MQTERLEDIKNQITALKLKADREEDINEIIAIKREIYNKKLALLDLIQQKDKARAGITARELIAKVKAMPKLPKFETGMTKIDTAMGGGFTTGLFINLAGESGAGKTTLLINLLANLSQGRKTVFFNFEMGDRLFAQKLENMKLSDKQLDNLIIDSETNMLQDLIMEIEIYAEEGIKFFAIDSKMKVKGSSGETEVQQISNMSSALSRLCARKDITIVLINQMNEEDIKSKRLAFKGSGDQKYDSDIALFLIVDKDERYLVCNKNRMNDRLFKIPISLNDYTNNGEPVIVEFKMEDCEYLGEIA